MQRKYKVLIGIGASLSMAIVGAVWLAHAAMGVVDDTVDTTLSAARSVEKIVQEEPVSAMKTSLSQEQKSNTDGARQSGTMADKEPVKTSAPESSAQAVSPSSKVQTHKQQEALTGTDDFAGIERQILPLLDDDPTDAINIGALTKVLGNDSGDDDWLTLIPGGKSPTLKGLMAGKYRGKEDQAIDDAIGDPQAWRLVSFLGGLL